MAIRIKGRVTGLIVGDGATATTHNGTLTSANGHSAAEIQRRYDAAREIGASKTLAQWYSTLAHGEEQAALEMFQRTYGKIPE